MDRLFPTTFDNEFRGHALALWIFWPFTIVTIARSLVHIFASDGGAQSIATIPLDQYVDGGAETVVSLFAFWGLAQLGMALVMLLACIRYRSMIPLLWVFVFVEWTGRLLIGAYNPIETAGVAPGAVGNRVIPLVALVMIVLACWPRRDASD
jgi:hypothetical protein